MKSDAEWMESYLLGGLDESELARFEERMLSDDALFKQLEFMEDQLIEAYVRDRLTQNEKRLFENHFMQSPRRRSQVELHLALQKRLGTQAASPAVEGGRGTLSSILAWIKPRPVLAAAYALGSLLAIVNLGLFVHLELERESIAQQRGGTPGGAYQLLAGALRGDQNALRLPPGSELVGLQLIPSFAIVPGTYSVSLKDATGATVWRSEWIVAPGREPSDHLSVALPGGVLQGGSYVLELARSDGGGSSEQLADYRFKVTK